MNLKNLKINNQNIQNKDIILDGIKELNHIIDENYSILNDKELAIEFNIGSKLGNKINYLVIYNNPKFKNNPYCFILYKDENDIRHLTDETMLETFQILEDYNDRKDIFHNIVMNFNRLPQHLFLSKVEIENARAFVQKYDKNLDDEINL